MKAPRPNWTLVMLAAALISFGAVGAFFHQHAPILFAESPSCLDEGPDTAFGHTHLLPLDDDEAEDCAICFFNRSASQVTYFGAHTHGVDFYTEPIVPSPDVIPDALPARLNGARAPPTV